MWQILKGRIDTWISLIFLKGGTGSKWDCVLISNYMLCVSLEITLILNTLSDLVCNAYRSTLLHQI